MLIAIPNLIFNSQTGHAVAIEIVKGKLTSCQKSKLKEAKIPLRFYYWLRRVALQMEICKRKTAISEWGNVHLLNAPFEEVPYYPIRLCDVDLAGMLGIDVMYITRIQTERGSKLSDYEGWENK